MKRREAVRPDPQQHQEPICTAEILRQKPQREIVALDDLRRHVLSKQVGNVIARDGGGNARFELPAQPRPDGTRDHAASEDHSAA